MALTIGDNFKYQANKPNFERDSFATLEAMKAYPETSIDDGHLSYCAETNKHYKFLSSNTVDETTGKWREFETGTSISEDGITGQVLTKTDNGYEWQDPQGSQEPQETRIVLDEFSERKFFDEFSKVTGAPAIGWAGALFIDDFSSSEYRDFYCCMTYGQGIVIRHTYKTGVYEYLNSFIVDSSTTSSSYNITNKMNSGGWGKYYDNSELPLVYISRCSPDSSYIHTYYAYKINRSVTPFKFEKALTIKYTGSKLAAITSDITIDAEKKYLYVHGYKSGSANAITGTSIVMVFNLPEPGSSNTITLADSNILWEFEFFVNEAAQDLCVSGGRLYYPYGSKSVHGIAVVDTKTGEILQNLDLANISTNFISNPEPEGVALSNGNLYLNYHHADTNSNEVCLVEFALQGVKESLKVPTSQSEDSVDIPNATQSTAGLMSAEDKAKLDGVSNNANNYTHPAGSAASKSLGLYKISIDSTSHVQSVSPVTKSDITSLGIPAQDTTYNNSTSTASGLMSASDKEKLDSINVDGGTINVVADARALKGATMRFSGFVNGVTITQTGVNEWDGIVYDTAINKFLAKKGTLSPTYHNIWTGMEAYMSDGAGTDILKDRLYLYEEDVYIWSDTEGTLVKVGKEMPTTENIEILDGEIMAQDRTSIISVDLMQLVHSNEQPVTSTKYMTVVSSTATSITLSSEDIANFPVSTVPGLRTSVVTAAVVGFSDGEYKVVYFGAPSENTLPLADFDNTDLTDAMSVQALFNDSQHLSASGYIAMGKFVADEIIKKTSLVDRNWIGGLVFNTLGLRKGTSNTPEQNAVYDLNDNVVCLPVFYNWMRGGFTPNGNNLVNDHGITNDTFNLYNGWVTKAYKVAQGKKGAYVEFPIAVSGKGFVEIQAGKVATKATSTGGCKITLYADGIAVGTQVLVMKQMKYTFSDITIKKEMRVRFTLLADEDTEFSIYSIGFWKMYQPVPAPIVDRVTRIAVLGDSWTQYPTADISIPSYPDWNTAVTRPDGTTGEGYGYFPKALANFTNAHVDNWGKGGMRSDNWGLVKINDILNYARYDYLIVEFFINDQTAGTSVSDWKQNIKRICDKCKQFGTRPIFIMPCGVKSSPQKAELGKWHEEVVKGLGA